LLNTPKNGKAREGAISERTLALIREWAELAEDPSPEGFVFPSERLTTPLSLDNLWRRYMLPKLEAAALGWATFQVLRKTNASLSKKAGVDPKVASDQRAMGSASAWRSTRARTSNRSEQRSDNSKPRCFEDLNPSTGAKSKTRLNGINGITRNRWVFPGC
jgi:integrase